MRPPSLGAARLGCPGWEGATPEASFGRAEEMPTGLHLPSTASRSTPLPVELKRVCPSRKGFALQEKGLPFKKRVCPSRSKPCFSRSKPFVVGPSPTSEDEGPSANPLFLKNKAAEEGERKRTSAAYALLSLCVIGQQDVRRPAEAEARAARRAQGMCKQAAFDRLVRRSIERRRSTVQSGPVRFGRTHGRGPVRLAAGRKPPPLRSLGRRQRQKLTQSTRSWSGCSRSRSGWRTLGRRRWRCRSAHASRATRSCRPTWASERRSGACHHRQGRAARCGTRSCGGSSGPTAA